MTTEGINSTTKIGKLPIDWMLKKAEEISLKVSKGTTPPKSEISHNGAIPFLRVNNLSFNGVLDSNSDLIYVSSNAHENGLARSKVYPGEILMNIVGPPLGKTALLDGTYAEYNMNQAIVFYRLDRSLVDNQYFLAFLCSSIAQGWLQSRSKKTSGQQNLTIELCKQLPVPLPPLPEQKKIAKVLAIWDRAITTTQQLLTNSEQQKKALMQQLLSGKKRLFDDNGVRFEGDWKWLRASDIFKPVSQKNNSNQEELLSVTQDRGVIPRSSSERRVTMPDGSTKGYKLVVPGNFIISLRSFQGGLELSKYRGLVSPAYSDFSFLKIPYPKLEEQQKIASVLSVADKQIIVLQKKLEALKLEKKALMQQLLTGKKRVKVESVTA